MRFTAKYMNLRHRAAEILTRKEVTGMRCQDRWRRGQQRDETAGEESGKIIDASDEICLQGL